MPGGDPFGMGGYGGMAGPGVGDPFGMPGMPGMPGGDPYAMAGMPGGMMSGNPAFDALMYETGGAAMMPGFDYAAHLAATGGTYDTALDYMYDPVNNPVNNVVNDPVNPGGTPDALDFSNPNAITGTVNPNDITATKANMVLTGGGGGDTLSNGGYTGVVFNYQNSLAFEPGTGRTQLWGEAYMDMINGGSINPSTGQDTNPANNQPAYGNDKGLGVGDVLRFAGADLYYGSTQLSAASSNIDIAKSANASYTGGGQIGDVCLFDAQYVGGSANNLIFAIDANGDGLLEASDVMFDVEDDLLSSDKMIYDTTNDVFTFTSV